MADIVCPGVGVEHELLREAPQSVTAERAGCGSQDGDDQRIEVRVDAERGELVIDMGELGAQLEVAYAKATDGVGVDGGRGVGHSVCFTLNGMDAALSSALRHAALRALCSF